MDFVRVLRAFRERFEDAGIRYALIGGFALGLRGVQRATLDLDLLLVLEDLDQAESILTQLGFHRVFRSKNVSHYSGHDELLGRIDILHAFRGPSLGMLERAEQLPVVDGISVPVLQVEDIIGLKLQAIVNDSSRATGDWMDVRLLLEASGRKGQSIDWELLNDYLEIFDFCGKMTLLKEWHGSANEKG